ncbi:MAG TPA: alpha/beta fold hydrolase [Solirubrobacteraceae bacterium]
MPSLEIDGLQVAYQRAGDGPSLVLLHGAIADSRVWRPQIEALSDEFTVVAWDAPGAGLSSDPPGPFGMADWADVVAALIRVLRLGPSHIVGHSWGGSLGIEVYRRHPGAAASLVLADTYAGWKGSLPATVCAERLEMALRTSAMSPDEVVAHLLPELLSGAALPHLAHELAAIMSEFHPVGLRLMANAMAETDLRDVLPRIDVPTLLLWGEADERSPLSIAQSMRDAIPGAELALIPGAGHDSNIEQPARFSAEVRAFCRTASG